MKRLFASLTIFLSLLPVLATGAMTPSAQMKSSVVFIVNYNDRGNFLGWGSGFFVDEGIVVTNKHVIEGADWYRVYATGPDDAVNMDCYRQITKSDVRINLNDDVAYMRAYLPCSHGMMNFAYDPEEGDAVSVLGYPYKGSTEETLRLTITTGSVIGRTAEGWLSTDAYLDVGNSGGPVTNDTDVVGVAVAKGVDAEGGYVEGYFIPASVILEGLLYANDSGFGYTPRSMSSVSRSSSSSIASSSSISSVSSSRASSSSRSSRGSSSSRRPVRILFPDVLRVHPAYFAVLSLHEKGVIGGYPDGFYRPENGINRAEFIKILVAGFKSSELRGETRCFSDVADEWFAPHVCAAKRLGWIEGYADGNFKPSQQVNRAEAMKILITAFGGTATRIGDMPSDVRSSAWYYPYVAEGVALRIVDPDTRFHPGDDLNRGDAAIWVDAATGS